MLRRSSSALAMGLWDSFPSVNGTTSTASGGTTTTTTTATATLPPSSAAAALVAGAASLRASGNGGGGQGDAFSQFAAGGQTAADVLGARASEVGTNVNDAFRGGWAAVSRMVGADDGAPIDVEACANGNGGQQSVQQVRFGVVAGGCAGRGVPFFVTSRFGFVPWCGLRWVGLCGCGKREGSLLVLCMY